MHILNRSYELLNELFDKNYGRQKAHRSLEDGDILSILALLKIENEIWTNSSPTAKEIYLKTAQFLTENIPLNYKDVTYEYFKLCVIFANINYQIRETKKLPEENEYSSYFQINYYGNFLTTFRPVLSQRRHERYYNGDKNSIFRSFHNDYDFAEDASFVSSKWNIDLGTYYDLGWGKSGSYNPHSSIQPFGFVRLKYLLIPKPSDAFASFQLLQKAVDIAFNQVDIFFNETDLAISSRIGKTENISFLFSQLEPFREKAYKKQFNYKPLFVIFSFIAFFIWIFLTFFQSSPNVDLDVPYDLDCSDVGQKIWVGDYDPHRLDRDGDGWGCETYG